MKINFEIRGEIPIFVTENGDIVENLEVIDYRHKVETTKAGPINRLIVEVKVLEQREVKVYAANKEQHGYIEADDPEAPWNNPDVSLVRLLSGKTVMTQVNGLDLETGGTGYVFADGEDKAVKLVDGEWEEVSPEKAD